VFHQANNKFKTNINVSLLNSSVFYLPAGRARIAGNFQFVCLTMSLTIVIIDARQAGLTYLVYEQ
jgi:hypothetical protein